MWREITSTSYHRIDFQVQIDGTPPLSAGRESGGRCPCQRRQRGGGTDHQRNMLIFTMSLLPICVPAARYKGCTEPISAYALLLASLRGNSWLPCCLGESLSF